MRYYITEVEKQNKVFEKRQYIFGVIISFQIKSSNK